MAQLAEYLTKSTLKQYSKRHNSMIFAHEIPSGSHLYFGHSAKLKRELEYSSAKMLEELGYQEILTPLFSYHQHDSFSSKKPLIRLNDADNHEVSLRADSTADVVRIVTKRLGRSSTTKGWFYLQPIFSFPTTEQYQIGAELIDGKFTDVCSAAISLLQAQEIDAILQIANIAIPKILHNNYGVSLDDIKSMNIKGILSLGTDWIEPLVKIHTVEDLSDLSIYPDDIAKELGKILDATSDIEYSNIVISPLYYAQMRYYDSLIFRVFSENRLFAKGGTYSIDEVDAAGFAIYTDACIEKLLEKGDNA